jgi:hypothetical protein
MARDGWRFTFTSAAVLAAAEKKVAHHQGRVDWWLAKRDEVLAKVRSEGIEIDESLAVEDGKWANTASYNRQPGAMIRQDLLEDIAECNNKVREHRAKVAGYEGWVELLGAPAGVPMELELEHADWTYFFSTR